MVVGSSPQVMSDGDQGLQSSDDRDSGVRTSSEPTSPLTSEVENDTHLVSSFIAQLPSPAPHRADASQHRHVTVTVLLVFCIHYMPVFLIPIRCLNENPKLLIFPYLLHLLFKAERRVDLFFSCLKIPYITFSNRTQNYTFFVLLKGIFSILQMECYHPRERHFIKH